MTETPVRCFHCGEVCPDGPVISVQRDGETLPMCCSGCQAVSHLIFSSGLDRYYQFRDVSGIRAEQDVDTLSEVWRNCDAREDLWGEAETDGNFDLLLQTEGVQCSACAWLIRSRLEPQAGIERVQVDIGSGYTRILWNPAVTQLSHIATELARIGYHPHLPLAEEEERGRLKERRSALLRLGVAGLGMMQVMMYAVGLYAGEAMGITAGAERFLEWISLLVTLPVVLFSGRPFFVGAISGLKAGKVGMDVPVALAIGVAFIASTINFARGSGEVYFDSVVMFVFFLSAARYVQLSQRHRNLQSGAALARLLPEWAHRVTGAGVDTVLLADLEVGDRVRVRNGEAFPADGFIVQGETDVDESLLTGESLSISRGEGDPVVAGSVNLASSVEVQLSATGQETTVSALGRMLLRARSESSRSATRSEKIAGRFVLAVLLIATLTGVYWLTKEPSQALPSVLAVLVVSCPCALSLATPAALAAASRYLLTQGVLLTNADALEAMASIDTVVFDKTGTLTRGRPALARTVLNPGHQLADQLSEADSVAIAAALEAYSSHPVARAFNSVQTKWSASDVDSQAREGVRGTVNGVEWRLGTMEFSGVDPAQPVITTPDAINAVDVSGAIWLTDKQGWLAAFVLEDDVRPGAKGLIKTLGQAGLTCEIFSGDQVSAVEKTANIVGVSAWRASLSPEMKMQRLRAMQQNGQHVLMIGDGVNDAPVLAAADVSMTVKGASELANSAADVILSGESLGLAWVVRTTADKTQAIIRQNMFWAIAYNVIALPLAVSGVLEPWMAALGMSASSMVVVANSTRLTASSAANGGKLPHAELLPS